MLAGVSDFQTPVRPPGYPKKTRSGSVWSLVDKFQIVKAKADDFIPDAYSTYESTAMKLQSVSIDPTNAAAVVMVTLNYGPSDGADGGTVSTHQDGQIKRSSRSDWREIPIDDARLVSSGFLTAETRDEKKKEGWATIGIGGIAYTYEEFIANFSWSESAVLAGLSVGQTASPAGMSGASSENWLVEGVEISGDGVNGDGEPITSRRSVYKYSAIGWENG